MKNKNQPLIGVHVSIAKGFDQALSHARDIGCTCAQIFTHSNRQWAFKPIDPERVEAFVLAQKETNIDPIVVHASYLLNLGSSHKDIVQKSLAALVQELNACAILRIPTLVIHSGTNCKESEASCCTQIAHMIDQAYEQFEQIYTGAHKPLIALETLAGQGAHSVGHRFEHLARIRDSCSAKKHLGFCVDTAHIFAAGYDIRTPQTYESTWQTFDSIVGIEHMRVIHANDSKKALDSHVDRHEHVGLGIIGETAFKLIMNDKRFSHIPKILEIPEQTKRTYAQDIAFMKSLISTRYSFPL